MDPAPSATVASSEEVARRDGSGTIVDSAADGQSGPRPSRRQEKRRRWLEQRRARREQRRAQMREGRPAGASVSAAPGAIGGADDDSAAGPPRGPQPAASETRPGASQPALATARPSAAAADVEGILVLERAQHGHLRSRAHAYLPARDDVHVPPRLVLALGLREGSLVSGRARRVGGGRSELVEVLKVDGRDPREVRNLAPFKSLTTIDPDFHYVLGDAGGESALKVVDVVCPIGRGQRGLIVASPRSGKTILLQQIARALEKVYPDVHLMVLLVDERPEEATEWQRTVKKGEVFVSTNDEPAERHVEVADIVWRRARRLVELGQDVVVLLDSITRLGRAHNNVHGNSGKTMSGGIDTRALEGPKQLFGSARNTEDAGSLTILGTTLVDTGSRMDQVIFEEFKGTGNMELVLSRKLADRRIFPAIDLEKSGTRKEEKLISSRKLKQIHTLRRVLLKMHWAEAMELLIHKLEEAESTDAFLARFEIDPDAGEDGPQTISPVRMRW
jgi:transcription termination factor Rho